MVSLNIKKPSRADIGGASEYIKRDILEPIKTKALKRHKSPINRPTTPDRDNQNQDFGVASTGKNRPLLNSVKIEIKINAITNRIILTGIEPIFLPALSKAIEQITQQNTVPNADISPK